jgi:PKD repeat protein
MDDKKVPELSGPSERGTSLEIKANPDVLTADGFSTSLIEVHVFDQNGQAAPGRTILLAIANAGGDFVDLGSLYSPTGSLLRAAEATIVSNGDGIATAVYTAPPRTDFTADGSVTVQARPVGTDFNGATYLYVRIELKSAEPRLFPGSVACGFVVEAPDRAVNCTDATNCTVKVGAQVLFQSTSSAVRFAWFWGDGSSPGDHPNENHVFRTAGAFTVTHIVTDAVGGQQACQANITVVP